MSMLSTGREEPLSPQLERGLPDADLAAGLHGGRLREAMGADVRPVGGAEVLHEPVVARGCAPRVTCRHVVVVEADGGIGSASDEDRGVLEVFRPPGVGSFAN